MKKKTLGLLLMSLLIIVGCSQSIIPSGNDVQLKESEGAINLSLDLKSGNPEAAYVLALEGLTSFDVFVKGTGMNPVFGNVPVGQVLSLAVPAGPNRVIKVIGKDSGGLVMPGVELYGYVDILVGQQNATLVTWNTTPTGAILEDLLDTHGIDLSTVNSSVLQGLVNNVNFKNLIDVVANANFYNITSGFSDPLILANAAQVSGILLAANGSTPLGSGYIVRANDPLSTTTLSVAGGAYSIGNIAPGTWTITVYNNFFQVGSTNVTFADGDNLNIDIITTVAEEDGQVDISIDVSGALVAWAGTDQSVNEGSTVQLDAGGSSGNIVSYFWTQISGPAVALSDNTLSNPTFVASTIGTYVFSVAVSDPFSTDIDTVVITAHAQVTPFMWQDFEASTVGNNEHPQNFNGAYDWWYVVEDSTVTTPASAVSVELDGANGTAKNFTLGYTLIDTGGPGDGNPGAGYGSEYENTLTTTIDLSAYNGFSFWAKGTGATALNFSVHTTDNPDIAGNFDIYGWNTTIDGTWTQYSFIWADLAQEGWGTAYPFNAANTFKIQILVKGADGTTGSLQLDEIRVD